MDFFKISRAKIDRYIRKYVNKPKIAYLKLGTLAYKTLLKEIIDDVYRVARRGGVNVAIILDGGLGDVLIGIVFANSFVKTFSASNCTVSVFVGQSVSVVREMCKDSCNLNFQQLSTFKYRDFDSVISLSLTFPRVVTYSPVIENHKNLYKYIKDLIAFEDELTGICGEDRQVNQLFWLLGSGLNRVTALKVAGNMEIDEEFTLQVPKEGYKIFDRYPFLKRQKFITISRAVGKNPVSNDSIRLWSISKYEELVDRLKTKYPSYKIVFLGESKEFSNEIKGVDVNLVGETSISELMAILKESQVHFDCECGMVHLRHFISRRPSIVLFGPTSPSLRGYPENINIRNNGICSLAMCEHILLDGKWSQHCLLNKSERGACIESISVNQVLDAFSSVI